MLPHLSDAAIQFAAIWLLIGYTAGFGLAVSIFWRRISKPADDTVRRLTLALQDADAQIGVLYRANDKLARLYARQAADVAEAEADASGRVA
jgi:hypothetical protein